VSKPRSSRGVRDSRPKSAYLVEVAVKWLVLRSPSPVFATFTFKENVTDLAEAKRRWRPLADLLRRKGLKAVGAWQRQKRGAWHCHLALSGHFPIAVLRLFAVERGWGTFLNLRPITSATLEKDARYIARYVTRDNEGADWGDCLTIYVGRGARVGTVRFNWAGGLAGVYRCGCMLYKDLHGEAPRC